MTTGKNTLIKTKRTKSPFGSVSYTSKTKNTLSFEKSGLRVSLFKQLVEWLKFQQKHAYFERL